MLREFHILTFLAAFAVQGCANSVNTAPPAPGGYFWLPILGITDDRTLEMREQLDAQLLDAGYTRDANPAVALALSTDAEGDGDGSLGLGSYAGGYVYVISERAPPGYVLLTAYDTQTRRPLWRLQWRADSAAPPVIDLTRGDGS
jgi:hypothetical protein